MQIKLLNNYLLVKKVEEKETEGFKTVSAINELIGKGELVAIPTTISKSVIDELSKDYDVSRAIEKMIVYPPIGSTIYFEKSLGTEFEINGQKVKFIKLEDVMGYE